MEKTVNSNIFSLEGENYVVGNLLGHGRCSEVYDLTGLSSGKKAALKMFNRGDKFYDAFNKEANILFNIEEENSYIVKPYSKLTHNTQYCIMMEKLDLNLSDIILNSSGCLPLSTIYLLAKDIASGLYEIHQRNWIHADIKTSNIMWSSESSCFKIIDFGLSFYNYEQLQHAIQCKSFRAPEVFNYLEKMKFKKSFTQPSFSSDIWGYGCLLLYTLTGIKLFQEEHSECEFCCTVVEEYNTMSELSDLRNCSNMNRVRVALEIIPSDDPKMISLKNLISLCLRCYPADRPNIFQVLQHDFLDFSECEFDFNGSHLILPTSKICLPLQTKCMDESGAIQDEAEKLIDTLSQFGPITDYFTFKKQHKTHLVISYQNIHQCNSALESSKLLNKTKLPYYSKIGKITTKSQKLIYDQDIATLHGACLSCEPNEPLDSAYLKIKGAILSLINRVKSDDLHRRLNAVGFYHYSKKLGFEPNKVYFESVDFDFPFLADVYLKLMIDMEWKSFLIQLLQIYDGCFSAIFVSQSIEFLKKQFKTTVYALGNHHEDELFYLEISFAEAILKCMMRTKDIKFQVCLPSCIKQQVLSLDVLYRNILSDTSSFIMQRNTQKKTCHDKEFTIKVIHFYFWSSRHINNFLATYLQSSSFSKENLEIFAQIERDLSGFVKQDLIGIMSHVDEDNLVLESDRNLALTGCKYQYLAEFPIHDAGTVSSFSQDGKPYLDFLFSLYREKLCDQFDIINEMMYKIKSSSEFFTSGGCKNIEDYMDILPPAFLIKNIKILSKCSDSSKLYLLCCETLTQASESSRLRFMDEFLSSFGIGKTTLYQADFEENIIQVFNQSLDFNDSKIMYDIMVLSLQNYSKVIEKCAEVCLNSHKFSQHFNKVLFHPDANTFRVIFSSLNHLISETSTFTAKQQNNIVTMLKSIEKIEKHSLQSYYDCLYKNFLSPVLTDKSSTLPHKIVIASILKDIMASTLEHQHTITYPHHFHEFMSCIFKIISTFNIKEYSFSIESAEYRNILCKLYLENYKFLKTFELPPILQITKDIDNSISPSSPHCYEMFVLILTKTMPYFCYEEWTILFREMVEEEKLLDILPTKYGESYESSILDLLFCEAIIDMISLLIQQKTMTTAMLDHCIRCLSQIIMKIIQRKKDVILQQATSLSSLLLVELFRLQTILCANYTSSAQLEFLMNEVQKRDPNMSLPIFNLISLKE